jgi:hypothetical protein
VRRRLPILAILILFAGLAARLPHLREPPLRFHATRQYWSALIARGLYVDHMRGLSPVETAAARAAAPAVWIEPPVMEYLAMFGYRLAGRETLAIPRLIAALWWTMGGVALWWLAAQLFASAAAATTAVPSVAVTAMMFLPFSIRASQSFQPDPMMTALMVLTLALAVRFVRAGSRSMLVLCAVAGAAAVLVKPMAILFLAPALLALAVGRYGWWRGMIGAVALVGVVSAGAVVFYASYSELGDRGPYPELWRQRAFWAGWLTMLDRVVPLPWAVASIAGTIVAARPARALLLGLWGGYLLLGFGFSHHIYTHDYYSLPVIPIAALSLAALVDACLRRLNSSSLGWSTAGVQAACVLCLCWGVFQAGIFEPAPDLRARVQLYERIGAAVDHSTKVASLDGDYGYPLSYHGLLSAGNWPLSIDIAMARMNGVTLPPADQRLAAAYADFFVATSQPELEAQPDLLAALERGHPVVFRDGFRSRWRAVVYDLRRRLP